MDRSHPLDSVARPKQARSQGTLERILDAAEALIEEKGLADASIPEIVRRAGSSVGGFYARFQDKAQLLRALEERFFDDVYRRLERLAEVGRSGTASVGEIVKACVAELVGVTRARTRLIQAFVFRAAQDPAFHADALRFRARVSERVKEMVLARSEPMGHPEPALAVDLGVQLAFGLMFQLVLLGEVRADGRVLSDAEIAREIERIVLRYFGVGETPASA
ncbi:MAG TPA: helix-turn-helix domain-containing protein [Myxococcota bacterium]|jgi:AcrR family transcriptional regulator|nr:helix-turn-helix domain-containing protein [Myxococcota bacterium]